VGGLGVVERGGGASLTLEGKFGGGLTGLMQGGGWFMGRGVAAGSSTILPQMKEIEFPFDLQSGQCRERGPDPMKKGYCFGGKTRHIQTY